MIAIMPMAGRGKRFRDRGIDVPKPFITVADRPMCAWAFESIADLPYSRVIFIALRDHSERYGLRELALQLAGSRAHVIELDDVTEGQLCTVMEAREFIRGGEDLVIASSDTFVESNLGLDIRSRRAECRGLISVASLPGERWSFAAVGLDGWVCEVAEKRRISAHASTGLYYFADGQEFVETADRILTDRERTLGEYYVIPVYQRYIDSGKRVAVSEARSAWDLGTPESLRLFESGRAPLT